jgi:hypothetical protein
MKLLFLLSKEADIDQYLSQKQQFIPFRYGPFDADVYDDLEALKELRLVQETPSGADQADSDAEVDEPYDVDTQFKLTPQGISKAKELTQVATKEMLRRITNIKAIFGKMPLVELLHYVYGKYDEYAKLSEANL